MKKTLLILSLLTLSTFASERIHVEALEDFNSKAPKETFKVKAIEDTTIDEKTILKDDIINCCLEKIKNPTRGKQDAKIYYIIKNWQREEETYTPQNTLIAKYSKTGDIKDKIKSIPPSKAIKKTAGLIGGYFVKGFSYGFSFVDGVVENQEGNRIKSGAKQVYDDSFLSLAEFGEDIAINTGDTFYFIVKSIDEITKEEQ